VTKVRYHPDNDYPLDDKRNLLYDPNATDSVEDEIQRMAWMDDSRPPLRKEHRIAYETLLGTSEPHANPAATEHMSPYERHRLHHDIIKHDTTYPKGS